MIRKFTLGLFISDVHYLQHLLDYVRNSEFAEWFQIRAYTKWSNVEDWSDLHRLIFDEMFFADMAEQDAVQDFKDVPVTLLTDREQPAHNELHKYQPLQRLWTQIYELCAPDSDFLLPTVQKRDRTELISLFSLSGGSGKTTLAIHLARHLALQGERVLYLNLEDIPSPLLCPGESSAPTLSEFLYYLKSDMHSSRDAKLVWLGNEHPQWKFFYFQPQVQFHEMNEWKEEEALSLLESIVRSESFRYIIVDLSSHLTVQSLACLAKSDRICWLVTDELQHLSKVESFLSFTRQSGIQQQWDWLHRTEWILNKSFGYLLNPDLLEPLTLAARLPFVNQWRTESSIAGNSTDLAFEEAVSAWLHHRKSMELEHGRT
jgi:hypothetical protein